MEKPTFKIWDYVVCIVMLVASMSIGIFHAIASKKKQTISEYMYASKSLTFLPVALSLIASFDSCILMLGVSAEGYTYGMQYVLSDIGTIVGKLAEQFLLLTFVKKLDLKSPFVYLEGRFKSRKLRVIAAVMACIENLFYMSIVLYGQSTALQAVTGFSEMASIFLSATVAVIYTAVGGLKAVIWTDVLQLTFMTAGMLALAVKGTILGGGLVAVWQRAAVGGRTDYEFDPDPTVRYNVWNLLFASPFSWLGLYFSPAFFQRVASTKSVKDIWRANFITIIGFALLNALALASGVVAYAYYQLKGCDPLASGQISSYNQISPFMIMDIFRHQPGLPGLFLAALFSASLSTMSSCLSAMSNITWVDIIQIFLPPISERKGLIIAKLLVIAFGVLSCCVALIVASLKITTLHQVFYSLTGITRGPTAALFYLGICFPFVNTKSAVAAVLAGAGVLTWIVIGSVTSPGVWATAPLPPATTDQCPVYNSSSVIGNITTLTEETSNADMPQHKGSGLDVLYSVSFMLYPCIGFLGSLLIGAVLSLLTGGNKKPVDSRYLLKYNVSWLPKRVRQFLGCHDDMNLRGTGEKDEVNLSMLTADEEEGSVVKQEMLLNSKLTSVNDRSETS